jgi:hypothetical protein
VSRRAPVVASVFVVAMGYWLLVRRRPVAIAPVGEIEAPPASLEPLAAPAPPAAAAAPEPAEPEPEPEPEYTRPPNLPASDEQLAVALAARIGYPVDNDTVAAAIETIGVREVDARELYGDRDVFALAARISPRVAAAAAGEVSPERSRTMAALVVGSASRFAAYYTRGLFYALPMVLQVATIALLRVGVLVHVSDAQATVIMVGSILSFIATGGFVQSIGRLGSVYAGRSSYRLARTLTYRLLALGLLASLALGGLLVGFGSLVGLMPPADLANALVYDVLLSALWLTLAVLYMLQRRALVLVVVVFWLGTFVILLRATNIGVYEAQWIAAAYGALIAAALGAEELARLVRRMPAERGVEHAPPARELISGTAIYFCYGALYFGFVFLDRLVAWTKTTPHGYWIFFQRPYELGLDWALLTLLLAIALVDYTVTEFSGRLAPTQERFDGASIAEHNRSFQRFYARQLGLLTALVIFSAIAVYAGGIGIRDGISSSVVTGFFGDSTTYKVFMWAALGYGLLVWGLLNVTFFFYLSRPRYAVRPLLLGAGTAIVVGLLFSRLGGYWESVVGLAVGAFVFAAATTRYMIRMLDRFDFYYYSAY